MRKPRAWFAFAVLLCSRDLLACAPAPREGERIDIVEESAVIIWEPATKTQHFIRRATFDGKARDFGFLVPTPGVPELSRVDDHLFDDLERKTSPQIVYLTEQKYDFTPLVFMPFLMSMREGATATDVAARSVEVLSTQKVAGYEAAVLDASDATALSTWLTEHGYATTPDLVQWLEAYIAQRWKITAFKIDKEQPDFMARTSAVKMTFTTERPFFPYREPASQRDAVGGPPRMLRVFFFGPERVRGRIGEAAPWPGELKWSDRIADLEAGGVKLPAGTRLTRFDDTSSPRPGTDELYFDRNADQGPVVPPPYEVTRYETTHIPLDVAVAPLVVLGGWWWWRRRKGQTNNAAR